MPWEALMVRRVPKLNNGLDCAQGQLWRFLAKTTVELLEAVYSCPIAGLGVNQNSLTPQSPSPMT